MSTQEIGKYTVIFVPQSGWDNKGDGGRVTTPKELDKFRPMTGHPVDEMLDAAIEIESEIHLGEVLDEHFNGQGFSFARERREYMKRASDEKLIEDYRERLSSALRLTRGHVPDVVKTGDIETLREYHQGLQEDINAAQDHIDCAVALRRNMG